MRSLLKAGLLLGALAAFVFLLPFGGRTLADRWRAADGAADFALRTWAEMKGEPLPAHGPAARKPGDKAQAKGPAAAGEAAPGDRPQEGHTDADRRELDRLLGQHLADPPKR